ncbi:MAG: zinc-dependent alcohol dehydrogenase [Patescibacteria group bacterium]
MRSIQYIKPDNLKYSDIPKPKIKVDEVLLKIKSVGICGTDLHIYHGGMNLPTPLIMGHEFSGIIAEVGSQVKNLKIGERVVGEHVISCGACHYCLIGKPNLCGDSKVIGLHRPGALAEYLAIPANLVYKISSNLSFDEASLIEPLSIAYYAVQKAGFLLGKKVAVIGQGPIGLLVDQILKNSGAHVIGIDIFEPRLKLARKKGWVDQVINSKKQSVAEEINKLMPEGVDICFEVVGQEITIELALEITRRAGDVFILGVFETPSKINLMQIVKKELNVHGSWTCAFSFPPVIELLADKKIDLKSLITNRYPASQGIKAFKEAASYSGRRIKSIINF